MVIIRTIFRLIMFIIAVSAIVLILGTGFWAFSSQSNTTIAAISMGDGSITQTKSPETIEEFFLALYLQNQAAIINTPIANDPAPVPFTVEMGDTGRSVGENIYR